MEEYIDNEYYAVNNDDIRQKYCPAGKCIRYPILKKYWQYQYQMLINNILTKSEDTKTKININDFYVLDKELADHLISSLEYDNYIRDIDGDMYAVPTSKTIGCDKENLKKEKIVNANENNNIYFWEVFEIIFGLLIIIILVLIIIKLYNRLQLSNNKYDTDSLTFHIICCNMFKSGIQENREIQGET